MCQYSKYIIDVYHLHGNVPLTPALNYTAGVSLQTNSYV